jgi:Mn2+/Fe2+ NRAMP family transporter
MHEILLNFLSGVFLFVVSGFVVFAIVMVAGHEDEIKAFFVSRKILLVLAWILIVVFVVLAAYYIGVDLRSDGGWLW